MFPKLLPKLRVKNDVKIIYILFGIVLTYFSIYMPDIMNVAGVDEMVISSTVSFGSLNGMLFGPFWGSIVSASGFLLYKLISGNYTSMNAFSFFSILFLVLSSVVSGLVVNREHKAAKSIFFVLIVAWYMLDVGREVYFYPWYHLLVLGIFIFFEKSMLVKTVTSKLYIFISLFLASLMGVLSVHMAGSITYHLLYDLPANMYKSVIFLYPVERTVLAFFPAFLVYVLFVVLKDIVLSSEDVEKEIEDKKSRDLEEYLQNDVLDIIQKK